MSLVIHRKGAVRATVVAVVLLASALSACADDDDDGRDGTRLATAFAKAPPPPPPAPPPSDKASPRWSTESWVGGTEGGDGTLILPNGTVIRGWGARRVRRYVLAMFRRMQYDFANKDMASVCRHVDPLLPSLPYTNLPDDASCERRLKAFARALERRGFKPSPLQLLWVREYPDVAGIWVEDKRGTRFRLGVAQGGKQRGWQLELASVGGKPEALAMPLRKR